MLRLLCAFISGAVLVSAFAPLNWWWMSFPCLASLFCLHRSLDAKCSFWLGFCFALGLYLVGVSWVYVSLSTYGGMPIWMGVIAVITFAALLASTVGIGLALNAWLTTPTSNARYFGMAVFWVLAEWIKSWLFTGFPWLDIGYTQTPGWIFGFAPLGGVYLVSLVAVSVALLLGYSLAERRLTTVFGMAIVFLVAWLVNQIDWSQPTSGKVVVGIVQGNVSVVEKWRGESRQRTIDQYQQASFKLQEDNTENIDLLVWPETALPLYRQQTDATFWRNIKPEGVELITGILDVDQQRSFNAAVATCGATQQVYRKRHLVPFGEYLPLRFMFNWLLDYLNLPMSDFSSWAELQHVHCAGQYSVGLSICYEDAFAAEHRNHYGQANMLVNISEDGWFGDTLAPHQRLQMAQMRARELARPMVRSANSGPSAFIDHNGVVVKQTAQFVPAQMTHSIQPQQGVTPFNRFGNWLIWILLAYVGYLVYRRIRHCMSG